jgi:phospholipid transport system transporter-binding protein
MSTAQFALAESSLGRFSAQGSLLFANAASAFRAGLVSLSASAARELSIDCAGVVASDSAGLAVLVEWLSWAKRDQRRLRLLHLPEQVQKIAQISELDELLAAGV